MRCKKSTDTMYKRVIEYVDMLILTGMHNYFAHMRRFRKFHSQQFMFDMNLLNGVGGRYPRKSITYPAESTDDSGSCTCLLLEGHAVLSTNFFAVRNEKMQKVKKKLLLFFFSSLLCRLN